MGRNKVLVGKDIENPLRKFFGVYLRLKRKMAGMSVEYMARLLDLSPTYYRLHEAGKARIGPEWASDLVRVFAHRAFYIDFSSLAIMIVGIATLEKSLIQAMDSEDPFQGLADYADFDELLKETRPYFTLEEGTETQKEFLETEVYQAVRNFLETSPGQRESGYPQLAIANVSAEGVEILKNLHRQLDGRPFMDDYSSK